MKYQATYKTMETLAGENYTAMLENYEGMKRHIGEIVLDAIKSNNWSLTREENPEIFELVDLWQLDDAYILNCMHFNASLHSHKNRTGTKYECLSYEITF